MGTFSVWHWLIVLIFLAATVLGMWTAWTRTIKYVRYVQTFVGLVVFYILLGMIGNADIQSRLVLLVFIPLPIIWFVWPHLTVRRLNAVGWRHARWAVVIPVVNQLLGLVLIFVKAREAKGKD